MTRRDLAAMLSAQRGLAGLLPHWRPIAWIGVTNSALPFLGFSIAALSIPAGLSSILNATSPIFGALIAMWWLRESGSPPRSAGLVFGFAGVAMLAWDYVLYFRLIARIGPSRAITVTFLIPAFAMLWASLFLGEAISLGMLGTTCMILLGTGLAAGLLRLPMERMR